MNNPETRPETWPEKEQPPRDDRLTRLQRALGETAVRGAQMPDSDRDPFPLLSAWIAWLSASYLIGSSILEAMRMNPASQRRGFTPGRLHHKSSTE